MTLEELYVLVAIASASSCAIAEDTVESLQRRALVDFDREQHIWRVLERGQVFIDHVLALPLPEPVGTWRMPGLLVKLPLMPEPAVTATEVLSRQMPADDSSPPAPPRPLNFRPGNPIPTDPEERRVEAKRLLDSGWGMNEVATQLEMPAHEVEAIFFGAGEAGA